MAGGTYHLQRLSAQAAFDALADANTNVWDLDEAVRSLMGSGSTWRGTLSG